MKVIQTMGFAAVMVALCWTIFVVIDYSKERDSQKGMIDGKPVTFSIDYATPKLAKRLVWTFLLLASGIGIIFYSRTRKDAKVEGVH